jgi:hypothetical protein
MSCRIQGVAAKMRKTKKVKIFSNLPKSLKTAFFKIFYKIINGY